MTGSQSAMPRWCAGPSRAGYWCAGTSRGVSLPASRPGRRLGSLDEPGELMGCAARAASDTRRLGIAGSSRLEIRCRLGVHRARVVARTEAERRHGAGTPAAYRPARSARRHAPSRVPGLLRGSSADPVSDRAARIQLVERRDAVRRLPRPGSALPRECTFPSRGRARERRSPGASTFL
jgi:hypothetical protein